MSNMNITSEKQPHDVEMRAVESPDEQVGESYALETRDRNKLFRWAYLLDDKIGIEAHGMEPTPETDRTTDIPYFDMMAIWMSSNGVAGSLTTGVLGPVIFELSMKSSIIICVFLNSEYYQPVWACMKADCHKVLGALLPAFSSTFGPKYGFRQMILSRYSFGYYGTKWIIVLEYITNIGWSLVTVIVAGQLMVAITDDGLPIIPSIIIVALIPLVISTFGYNMIHTFTRYAWIVSFLVLIVFTTIASLHFDASWPDQGSGLSQAGNVLSFMGVIFGSACGYTPVASDYYCKYPSNTLWWKPAFLTWAGIVVAGILFNSVGAAIGVAIVSDPTIGAVYDSGGFGATIALLFEPLGGFGKLRLALWWLGSSANLIGNTYSNSLAAQIFGFGLDKIPRFLFAILSTIIYTVIAIAGRDRLVEVVEDFLSILGYWVTAYFVIIFEEHFFFRLRTGYNKDVWNSPKLLPPGIAAIVSFWIGVIGMCLGMAQSWFVGPLSAKFGPYGGDLGAILTAVFIGVSYPILRALEMQYFKR